MVYLLNLTCVSSLLSAAFLINKDKRLLFSFRYLVVRDKVRGSQDHSRVQHDDIQEALLLDGEQSGLFFLYQPFHHQPETNTT